MEGMRKVLSFLFVLLFLAGCSGMGQSESKMSESRDSAVEQAEGEMSVQDSDSSMKNEKANDEGRTSEGAGMETLAEERKVIYTAEIHLEVKDIGKAQKEFEGKASAYGGYIVESNANAHENQRSGTMTFRVPQEHFSSFISDAENAAARVANRHVSGQDVTEEYVDLEARLRSKKAVEGRLLKFMEDAEKTEDLLKISSDLSAVQEQIEQLQGRIKYLQNQTSYSTVTIFMEESPHVMAKSDLNLWQKIEKQFAVNINVLLSIMSGLIVMLIGNLPILFMLTFILALVWAALRRRRKGRNPSGAPIEQQPPN
ncbi:DUF4349 domain-containing protein [Mesobacillus campisalis]|nr:DUF4349 domain-containing protein [Mesobacillus campisalis]